MRRVAGLAIVLGCMAGHGWAADPNVAARLAAAAFVAPPIHAEDSAGDLASRTNLVDGAPAEWRTGDVRLADRASGAVDSLRISLATPVFAPGRLPILPGGPAAEPAYEVAMVRNWPGAVSLETARFGVDFTPHAGLGMSNNGGLAEAGATVSLSQKLDAAAKARLRAMGVRDGAEMGGRGRWYVFAAASGQAVGLNLLHGDSGWNRAGWTTDASSRLVGDAQVGVGWRKGPMQTSMGLVHRETKGDHMLFGQTSKADTLVAFSFSVRPRK